MRRTTKRITFSTTNAVAGPGADISNLNTHGASLVATSGDATAVISVEFSQDGSNYVSPTDWSAVVMTGITGTGLTNLVIKGQWRFVRINVTTLSIGNTASVVICGLEDPVA